MSDKTSNEKIKNMKLMDRDYQIFREVERWRFCLGRHIRVLVGFTGERASDRRLKILLEAGYLERKKILYGIPSVYFLTSKGKLLIGVKNRVEKFRIEQIPHDISVLDTAIYILSKYEISLKDIITEKQLHSQDGFSNRKHYADFTFTKDNKKTYAVEVELTLKAKTRLENNIKMNYVAYDFQIWVVSKEQTKLLKLLDEFSQIYSNIIIIFLEEINNHVKLNQNNNNSVLKDIDS